MERNGHAEETYYTFSYSPIPDDDGTPGGIICANSDDTGQVVSERQLAQLAQISVATGDARTWRDACERAIAAIGSGNRDLVFAALYARNIGETALSLVTTAGIEAGHPALPARMSTGAMTPWPVAVVFGAGSLQIVTDPAARFGEGLPLGVHDRPVHMAAALPVPQKGESERDMLLLVGLNPYRLAETGYRTFLERLATLIADAVANADAYEAERRRNDALAELDRAKTTFFSNVSHEFRTPLTLMLGPLEELLSDDTPAETRRDLIETAHRNGVRLLRLVNSLLDFSRIEAGRVQASYVRTDLGELTREIAATFRSAVERAGMTLDVETGALSTPAYVDRDMWEKILLNPLSNAFKFTLLLTVILGGLDTLQRARVAEEGRPARALEMAQQGAQRAAGLTSRLLAFSRQQPLDPKPTELDQLIFAMSEILHRTLGEQITLEAVLPPDLWAVEVDQNQLESAPLNLAVNARDAMRHGGTLTIAARNTALAPSGAAFHLAPGDYVAIAISDTGHGMSRETAARAFDPFFTTKSAGQDTGLGLSMVYGFAKQSGGHITIDSAEERGATVTLYFPRHHGGGVPRQAPPPERIAPAAREGEVVLVVEDNDAVRLYGTSILAELGYRVLEATNGREALSVIGENRRIDLLFTDVVLPGMSGKAIANQARTLRPDLEVLYATGYSRDAIVQHGRVEPGVNLLTKPFTYEQVASRMREILDR